jgi:hypothetical protein
MALILVPITLAWVAFVASAVFRVPIALTLGGVALWLWLAINSPSVVARLKTVSWREQVGWTVIVAGLGAVTFLLLSR